MAKLKIDVNDLHKQYGKNKVLKGITTKFYEGDVVCIIGPSGSGKSTFLRSLNLLEEVTSGHITVNGYDLTEKTTNVDHVRENIGMVFQHFNPCSYLRRFHLLGQILGIDFLNLFSVVRIFLLNQIFKNAI